MTEKIDENITESAHIRIKKMLDDQPPGAKEIVNIRFSTQERVEIYNEVLGMIRSGEPDYHIAQQVICILNNHIEKKLDAAKERSKGKSPIFRRVDE